MSRAARQAIVHHVVIQVFVFRFGDNLSRPALLGYGLTRSKSGVLTRELSRTAMPPRKRRRHDRPARGSYLTAGRPIL
jgi:hypothetical protein